MNALEVISHSADDDAAVGGAVWYDIVVEPLTAEAMQSGTLKHVVYRKCGQLESEFWLIEEEFLDQVCLLSRLLQKHNLMVDLDDDEEFISWTMTSTGRKKILNWHLTCFTKVLIKLSKVLGEGVSTPVNNSPLRVNVNPVEALVGKELANMHKSASQSSIGNLYRPEKKTGHDFS